MTEKRFEIDSRMYGATDVEYWLKDNANKLVDGYGDEIYWGNGSSNGLKQIVNKLNELNDENKQLRNDYSILVQSNQEYRKENEQLKLSNRLLLEEMKEIRDKLTVYLEIRKGDME